MIINDNYLNESRTQIFLGEIINKTTQKFCFSCEFLVNAEALNVVYQYSVEIGKSDKGLYEIQSEILKVKNANYANNKYSLVFESKDGELLYVNSSDKQRELLEKKSLNLLISHSFIYLTFTNLENDIDNKEKADVELLIHIGVCFLLAFVIRVYLEEEDQHELYFWRKRLMDNHWENQTLQEVLFEHGELTNVFSSVNEKTVDKHDFERYRKKIEQLTEFIKIFKPDLVSIDIDRKENGEQYECELNLNYGSYSINREFESTGIKKLIRLFDCFVSASSVGIVFVDEMDSNLNDVYLCNLIEYFMYYGKGQLCFTTHNLDPMSVLKRNRNSIDFLSSDNHLVPWTSRGNASPENCYKNGMIEDSPFNIDPTDFIGIFGE